MKPNHMHDRATTPAIHATGWRAVVVLLLWLSALSQARMLTLSEAEHAAATVGFEMRAQHFTERIKEWEKWKKIAGYLPSIDYTATYMRMDEETVNATKRMTGRFPMSAAEMARSPFAVYEHSLKHEFEINQPISNGGMEIVGIRIGVYTKKAVELQMEAARQGVIYDARKAYFDAIAARERRLVAEQALSWTRHNLTKSRARHEAGAIPVTDVLQWEADAAEGEGDLLEARATERFMVLSLFQTMGTGIEEADTLCDLQPLEVFQGRYAREPMPAKGSVTDNPQLQAVKLYTRAARLAKGIAIGEFLPKLNAFVNYGWPAYDELLPPENTRGWTAGVIATVPVFSGFRNGTNYKKVKYEYLKTVVEEEETENQLAVNLDRIASFYGAAYGKVAASSKQNDLMKKQLDIMQQRYDAGLVNQSQLLEVELGARQTQIGYIQALFECLLLEAEYLQNTGALEVTQ